MAVALVLLTCAGVLIRSFYRFENQSRSGFNASGVLTARLPIASGRFQDADALNSYLQQIMMQVQSVPGVRDVAFAEGLPTQGTLYLRGFQVTGQPQVERARRPIAALNTVTPSYFRALGLQILKGRALAEGDLVGAPLAVVINDTFAKTYLRSAEPIGQRLVMSVTLRGTSNVSNDGLYDVVGVVVDEGLSPWTRAPEPMMYLTRAQNPSDYVLLIVRSRLDPARLRQSVSQAVSEFDHTQALSDMKPLDDLTREFLAADRYRSMLLNMFATIALALAATGLYGVVSHVVMQRQREMGIRVALGASVGHTIGLVVRDGMSMTMLGVILGLAGAISAQHVFAATVVGVERFEPQTMLVAAGLLSLVALIACYIPARRAARVDPCVTLKAE